MKMLVGFNSPKQLQEKESRGSNLLPSFLFLLFLYIFTPPTTSQTANQQPQNKENSATTKLLPKGRAISITNPYISSYPYQSSRTRKSKQLDRAITTMKQLWRRASGVIKDRNSILMASLTMKKKHRHPELESAVIKATSHDDSCVNYKYAQRVFMWVRTSPSHLITFLCMLTRRVERTRDWAVALKSLILLHGVLTTKAPGTRKIGRLPFDLSSFEDGYVRNKDACSAFVQAYFLFLDLESATLSAELKEEMEVPITHIAEKDRIKIQLTRVKRWQDLLDAVIHVKPFGGKMTDEVVVLEAMDCMVIEVFELYSKICEGIAKALMKIYNNCVGEPEASMALDVLQKANIQGEDLSDYFNFCKKTGLLHENECPAIQPIPEADFTELKKIIQAKGVSPSAALFSRKVENEERGLNKNENDYTTDVVANHKESDKSWLKTVITDKWELFEEDSSKTGNGGAADPFAAVSYVPPVIHLNPFVDYETRPQHVLNLL